MRLNDFDDYLNGLKSMKSKNLCESVMQTVRNIVTQGHGGKLVLDSKPGEMTFVVKFFRTADFND
jgi:hypothetical protein